MKNVDFDKMIDSFLEQEKREKKIGRYYPSEIGTCLRKVWYSYKHPKETEPELIKIFEVGNIVHEFIAKVFKSEKNSHIDLLEEETPFVKEIDNFTISGRIDDLILLKEDNKKLLVEVKSTKSIGYVKEASDAHVAQLQLYMHFTDVHEGVVLYIDKTNLQTKWFHVTYNKEEAEKVIDRFKVLHKTLTSDVLPVPEARGNPKSLWMCRFCDYNDKCYSETPRSEEWK
jgi:CRISPR/Cas system-associated exonuclease Cas4 (RecB family)